MSAKERSNLRLIVMISTFVLLATFVLLSNGCQTSETTYYLIPRDVAKQLDVDEIIEFCSKKIVDANYEGMLRGPYGTLWAGAGNNWDRALLAAAIMREKGIETRLLLGESPTLLYDSGSWWQTSLDGTPSIRVERLPHAAVFAEVQDNANKRSHTLEMNLITFNKNGNRSVSDSVKYPVRRLLHVPVTIVAKEAEEEEQENDDEKALGGLIYHLQIDSRTKLKSTDLNEVHRAELQLTWRFGDRKQSWTRELFDRANQLPTTPGHSEPLPGDCYAIVVSSGPLLPEVKATREFLLTDTAYFNIPAGEPAADLIRLATEYLIKSDEQTHQLAKQTNTIVSWSRPRITIAASERVSDKLERRAISLDIIADEVDATGKCSRQFHVARGMSNDLLETRVVHQATKKTVISASSLFSKYTENAPTTSQRRLAQLAQELIRLLNDEPIGTTLKVATQLPRGEDDDRFQPSFVQLERSTSGFRLKRPAGAVIEFELQPTHKTKIVDLAGRVETELQSSLPRTDFLYDFQLDSKWHSNLSLAQGSVLQYRIEDNGKISQVAVAVKLKRGRFTGSWVDIAGSKNGAGRFSGPLERGRDPQPFEMNNNAKPLLRSVFAEGGYDDATISATDQLFELSIADKAATVNSIDVRFQTEDGVATARYLDFGPQSLLLHWESNGRVLSLESVSPVIRGKVVDDLVRQPQVGAIVSQKATSRRVTTAVDGSFSLPVSPKLFRRLLIVLDRSGSMRYRLDPNARKRRGGTPIEEQRITVLKRAVHGLLDELPHGIEVGLWSYAGPRTRNRGTIYHPGFPSSARRDVEFTVELQEVREALEGLKPDGGTPLTGAVHAIMNYVREEPEWRDTVVVLLADGDNDATEKAADAYRSSKQQVVIHTVGFAIEPGGKAEQELSDLAEVSGGSYGLALTRENLNQQFRDIAREFTGINLQVRKKCFDTFEKRIASTSLSDSQIIQLKRGCDACLCDEERGFLTIRANNVHDLKRCNGLSIKAEELIRKRVADGKWVVTIPKHRVPLGGVSAYGWFELEHATGRMVGRTEDGLHGSIADPHQWPIYQNHVAKLPMTAWVEGLTAYTAGSVKAALQWHRQPGFHKASPDAFKRFVQSHALEFTTIWWNEVGSDAFGEHQAQYWAGVCLNHHLQSHSLGLSGDSCYRRWAHSLCERIVKDMLAHLEEGPSESLNDFLEERYGEENAELIHWAILNNIEGISNPLQDLIEESALKNANCARFLNNQD